MSPVNPPGPFASWSKRLPAVFALALGCGGDNSFRPSTSGEWPNPIYVQVGASGIGTAEDPMGDLELAVAKVDELGEVRIYPGTYVQRLAMGRSVRLTGLLDEQGRRPVITAPPGSATVIAVEGDFEIGLTELVIDAGTATGIDLRGPRATLKRVEVQNGADGVYLQGGRLEADQLHVRGADRHALLAQGGTVRLTDVRVDGAGQGPGLRFEASEVVVLGGEIVDVLGFGLATLSSNTTLTAVRILGVTATEAGRDGDGLIAGPLRGGVNGTLQLAGSDLRDAERAGLILFGTTAGTLTQSQFVANGLGGVWLQGTAPARLEGSLLEGNGLLNAYAGPGAAATLIGNQLLDPIAQRPLGRPPEVSASYGVVADGARLDLQGNALVGAAEAGLMAAGAEGVLSDTLISDCPTGLLLQDSAGLVAAGTRFVDVAEPQRILVDVEITLPQSLVINAVDPAAAPQPDP